MHIDISKSGWVMIMSQVQSTGLYITGLTTFYIDSVFSQYRLWFVHYTLLTNPKPPVKWVHVKLYQNELLNFLMKRNLEWDNRSLTLPGVNFIASTAQSSLNYQLKSILLSIATALCEIPLTNIWIDLAPYRKPYSFYNLIPSTPNLFPRTLPTLLPLLSAINPIAL